MKSSLLKNLVAVSLMLMMSAQLMAQGVSRTSWEMHAGLATTPYTVVPVTWNVPYGTPHGDPIMYGAANIPGEHDAGWGPAPNGETIGFGHGSASVIDNAGYGCWEAVDYTYFQTIVNVPANSTVNTFTISFSGMDDGSRITIFNSANPSGLVIPGSYVYLGATATSDLAAYVTTGDNRVVITQVDDCPTGNNLNSAVVVLNGETVEVCEAEYQTITILGANGTPGDVDPYADASLDGGQTWQPAILTGGPHPFDTWFFGNQMIPGTNSWINYRQDWNTPGGNISTSNPFYVDFRIRFYVPADYADPSMNLQVRVDNAAVVSLNGTEIANINDYGSPSVPEAILAANLIPGQTNEITLKLVDYGGLVAMAYRIDLSMYSCEDLTDAVEPSDNSNASPTADAGMDQTLDCVNGSASVTLSGSGDDADGDDLTYTWSDGTNSYSGAVVTVSQGDGSQTYTLTVSDGTAETTDDVTVTVNVDDTAPAISAMDNISVSNDEGVCGAAVSFDLSATDACGVTSLVADPPSGSTFDVGVTVVNITASDAAGNTSTSSFTVTVEDDEVPTLTGIEDRSFENDPGLCGATVSFVVDAADNCGVTSFDVDPASGSFFEVGTTEVTVTASDEAGNTTTSTFNVTVEDTEAPTFTANAAPLVMWPPNHKYRTFDVSDFVVTLDDNCSTLGNSDVLITSVSSDEVEDARGGGDGKTRNDMVIGDGSVDLRAERQGGGNGRVYTIHMVVADEHGNSTTASCQVTVPHSRNATAVDDGAVYTVNGASLSKFTGSDDAEDMNVIPEVYALSQNYPNPFNPSTTFSYALPEAGHVNLAIYDMRGSVVSHLVNDYQSAGTYNVSFNAADIAAGTYLYVLEANGERFVRRMLLLK